MKRSHLIFAIVCLFSLCLSISAKERKATAKSKKASVMSKKMRSEALLNKLVGIAIKIGVDADSIEITKYAIKNPEDFTKVLGHAVAEDYPFFALVGAVKAARDKNFPGVGTFTRAKCEMPIAFIDQVFGKADTMIDDTKGKQDTNAVVNVAKEYAADYAKALTAQAKQEAIDELSARIPYFGEIRTVCSFAFDTNLQIEKNIQKAIKEKTKKLLQVYKALDKGDYADGVVALIDLGANAEIACDFIDQSVTFGVIGRVPALGTLAKGACSSFAGKVFEKGSGLVKGGIGIIEDGVTAAVDVGKGIGCTLYSVIGNGCSSASPPDPLSMAVNAAKSWCSPYGGLKDFLTDSKRTAYSCNDGSGFSQRVGEKPYAFTAAEKAANYKQKVAQLQEGLKTQLPKERLAFTIKWLKLCPLDNTDCQIAIAQIATETENLVKQTAKTSDPASPYSFIRSLPFLNAEAKAQKVVREAEFRLLSAKWVKDFDAYWLRLCVKNQTCEKTLALIKVSVPLAASQRYQDKPEKPYATAMAIYYADADKLMRAASQKAQAEAGKDVKQINNQVKVQQLPIIRP